MPDFLPDDCDTASLPADLPPYPSAETVGAARYPPPPKLAPAMSASEKVRLLTTAYRSSIEHETGEKSFVFRGSDPKPRTRGQLLNAAAMLINHDLAPHSWCHFHASTWWHHSKERPPPTILQVYRQKLIEKRRGWCRRFNARNALGGQCSHGKTYLDMLARYDAMTTAMLRDHTVKLSDFFPGDSYEEQLAVIRLEGEATQAEYEERIADGEWLW